MYDDALRLKHVEYSKRKTYC